MPSVSLINTIPAPKLIFPPKVFEELRYIVDKQHGEIGWLFTIDRNEAGDFIVDEIFIPKQEVHSTEADIDAQAYLDIYNLLDSSERDPSARLYGWGHSHVNMGVTPSGQDDTQFMEYGETCPFFIRTIHNKKGEIRVDIAFFEDNLLYSNCNWEVQYAVLSDDECKILDDEMLANVVKAPISIAYYGKGSKSILPSRKFTDKRSKATIHVIPGKLLSEYQQWEINAMTDTQYYSVVYGDGYGSQHDGHK